MKKFENTCDICKFFSRFDRWCRMHGRKTRPEWRVCAQWEADEARCKAIVEYELKRILQRIQNGDIKPSEHLEEIGLRSGGWAWLRFYDPETHEYEIEVTDMPWEEERKTIIVHKYRKEKP